MENIPVFYFHLQRLQLDHTHLHIERKSARGREGVLRKKRPQWKERKACEWKNDVIMENQHQIKELQKKVDNKRKGIRGRMRKDVMICFFSLSGDTIVYFWWFLTFFLYIWQHLFTVSQFDIIYNPAWILLENTFILYNIDLSKRKTQ